jgi:tetratricopeptide (TPR) repeat protein
VLRGSVRLVRERVRIIVQLIDAYRGAQIWSERFEDDLNNVFDIQDRVATQAAAMVGPALRSVEIERAYRKPTDNLTAYDLYLRAVPIFRRSPAANEQALQFLRRAIELDPSYAAAFALAARCFHFQRVMGWVHPGDPRLQEGVRLANAAGEIGHNDSEALWMAGLALVFLVGELDRGAALIEKSIALNPNSANAWIASCFAHGFLADSSRAIDHFTRAQRLNPLDTIHHVRWNALGNAHFIAGQYEQAADAANRTLRELPTYPPGLRMKVATCGLLDRSEEGRHSVRQLLAINPDASVSSLRAFWQPLLRRTPDALERYLRGLQLAGLPEQGAMEDF